jgi:chorismate synthase
LTAILEGLPAGLPLDFEAVQKGMMRRWEAYGRGKRASFEKDALSVLSGMKKGVTLGSPLTLGIGNADQKIDVLPNLTSPRPGHVDLPGVLRNQNRDIRALLERASARETASRTALGEVASQLLAPFGVEVFAWVRGIGGVEADWDFPTKPNKIGDSRARSAFFGLDDSMDGAWKSAIQAAEKAGDSLGGLIEVAVFGCPPGLGGFDQPVDRLDARLMATLASVPAIKGVSIGAGFSGSGMPGSSFHDGIYLDSSAWSGLGRLSNHAGGVEGGLSNGQPIRLFAAMKPIPTLRHGVESVDLEKHEEARATYERSDVCAVSAASVVAESVVALEIASALRARLGGVTFREMMVRFGELGKDQQPSSWPDEIGD